jgi:hypothetical protein
MKEMAERERVMESSCTCRIEKALKMNTRRSIKKAAPSRA